MRQIPLGRGYFAMVDDADFDDLSRFAWHARKPGNVVYAARSVKLPHKDGRSRNGTVLMHRQLLNAKHGEQVDHRDLNGLNNQRLNLRVCTNRQNHGNMSIQAHRRYKGVHPSLKKWFARIKINYKAHHLGTFDTAEEAARAYDKAAHKAFGEFARTNF